MTLTPRESTLHEPPTPRKVAVWRCAWVISSLLLSPLMAAAATGTYTVAFDRDLSAATVDACFGADVPASLSFGDGLPPSALSGMVPDAAARGGYRARNASRGCVHYALALKALRAGDFRAGFQRFGATLLIDPTWLLAIPATPGPHVLDVHFVLPRGFRISAPADLTPVASAARHEARWRVRLTTRAWSRGGILAIGRIAQARYTREGTVLQISVVGRTGALPTSAYVQWVDALTATAASHFGRFPLPFLQLLIVLTDPSDEAIPWGGVHRAGGDALVLFVDRSRGREELVRDWVGYHELAHLIPPYLPARDAWWVEGLASYYQNVLRTHAGVLAPQVAWRALAAGFERGRREGDGRTTQREDSGAMLRTRHHMRVDWSGAAVALLADVELRLRSGGRQSLSSVLSRFARCCLPADRRWSAREFVHRLDVLAGLQVFEPLYDQHFTAHEFPALEALYEVLDLGTAEGRLTFGDAPASRRLREAIMGAETPAR